LFAIEDIVEAIRTIGDGDLAELCVFVETVGSEGMRTSLVEQHIRETDLSVSQAGGNVDRPINHLRLACGVTSKTPHVDDLAGLIQEALSLIWLAQLARDARLIFEDGVPSTEATDALHAAYRRVVAKRRTALAEAIRTDALYVKHPAEMASTGANGHH
jgi:fructose-specific phosphotransferase system component IIB